MKNSEEISSKLPIKYDLKIIGDSFEHYNHTITSNNTVNGNSIYYWIVEVVS